MKEKYCPKCGETVPMLEEGEFEIYSEAHRQVLESIQRYRKTHNVELSRVPLAELREPALRSYEELTGYKPRHEIFDHLWHHRVRKFERSNDA